MMPRNSDLATPLSSNVAGITAAAYDLDAHFALPRVLRLRTIHLLSLMVAVLSLAAAIEFPRAWQLVALGDLAATSVLFALAAGREWCLRGGIQLISLRSCRPSLRRC